MSERPKSATPLSESGDAPPSLSLAMIVRDGGRFLAPLLNAARDHVDEIVVGDTGSADDSVAIVERAGGRSLQVSWQDDFAAARNAVLAACRGDWVLVLDADERLDPAGWRAVREWITACESSGAPAAASFVTRNYVRGRHARRGWRPLPAPDPWSLPGGAPAAGYVPSVKVRLFPAGRGVRFQGRLHETVEVSLRDAGVPVAAIAAPVHHLGCLDDDPRKTRRYLLLAEQKTGEQPHDPQAWAELADCAVAADDPGLALVAITRALALEPGRADRQLTAGWLLLRQERHAEAEPLLAAAAAGLHGDDVALAECQHARAQIAIAAGRNLEAGRLLAEALRLAPGNGHVLNTLGVWHSVCGRGEDARRALEQAVRLLPDAADPLFNLGRLYEAAGHLEEAARHYSHACERDPSHARSADARAQLQPVPQA